GLQAPNEKYSTPRGWPAGRDAPRPELTTHYSSSDQNQRKPPRCAARPQGCRGQGSPSRCGVRSTRRQGCDLPSPSWHCPPRTACCASGDLAASRQQRIQHLALHRFLPGINIQIKDTSIIPDCPLQRTFDEKRAGRIFLPTQPIGKSVKAVHRLASRKVRLV